MTITDRDPAGSIAGALRRVARAVPGTECTSGTDPAGALGVDRLADDARAMGRLLAATGVDDAKARAAWFIQGHAWRVASPAVGCQLLLGRAPDLRAGSVSLVSAADGGHRVHFRDHGGSPAGPRTAPELREALEAHMAAVLGAPGLAVLGGRARWALAGDTVAAAALHVGRALVGAPTAIELAAALIAGPGPLAVPLALIATGTGEVTRRRTSCCLAHRAGHELCPTCPRRRPPSGERAVG